MRPLPPTRTNRPSPEGVLFRESALAILFNDARMRLFQRLTRNGPNLFLRADDLISARPQLFGVHEPAVTSLIRSFAENGHADFLIDIGANIGITSCQNGGAFRRVHMFEPNPMCCRILEVNAALALDPSYFVIHSFGLGARDARARLTVPRHNWGGAFIRDANNAYSAELLARKDGFDRFDAANYFDVDIELRECAGALAEVFAGLADEGLVNGVIKIDVEGYEPTVLAGVAAALPANMKLMIVFESWDPGFDMTAVLNAFQGRATAYKLVRSTPWQRHWPEIVKAMTVLVNAKVQTRVVSNAGGEWRGDIVLQVT